MYKVDGILIDNKNEKGKKQYIATVSFKDLVEICSLGNIAINRGVEEKRAQKMTQYIMEEEAFYPPIVVSSSFENTLKYEKETNKIIINIEKDNQKLTIIDGQHRYLSIAYLLKNTEKLEHQNRRQSIFIINNINDYEQRKIFMDINDNASRVKPGTKIRFEKSISNYFSLIILDEIQEFCSIVKMDLNQTADVECIPYKYIVCLNSRMLQILSEEFSNGIKKMTEIKVYKECVVKIWVKIKELIDICIEDKNKIITNEAFFIGLGKKLAQYYDNDEFDLNKLFNFIDLVIRDIENISREYFDSNLKLKTQKEEKIIEILNSIGE